MCYTYAYTAYGVKAALCPAVPNNEGALRPIKITAPEGSILNSRPPAAGGARAVVGHFLPMMVLLALSRALPERVISGVGSPLWCLNYAGTRADGKSIAGMFFVNGGYGASARRDGYNVLSWPSNISSTPVEMIEQLAPLKIHYRRLRTGTGGKGQYRGGTGQESLLESRALGPLTISFLAERTRPEAAAPGIAGGGPGAPGVVLINGHPVDPKRQHVIDPGDRVELRTPGGGGFGPPSGVPPKPSPTTDAMAMSRPTSEPAFTTPLTRCASARTRHRYRRHVYRYRGAEHDSARHSHKVLTTPEDLRTASSPGSVAISRIASTTPRSSASCTRPRSSPTP
jgi:N-methylhydantoinase B